VDIAFAAEVDVTGVVNDRVLRRVGRFHRSELRYQVRNVGWRFLSDFGSTGTNSRWVAIPRGGSVPQAREGSVGTLIRERECIKTQPANLCFSLRRNTASSGCATHRLMQ
jgi:hypothetical protein